MNHSYCQSAMGWKDNSDFSGLYDTTVRINLWAIWKVMTKSGVPINRLNTEMEP